MYSSQLEILTNLVYKMGASPIHVTQTTGYGQSSESFIVARTIIKHCYNNNLLCLDLAKNLDLKYEDFYDESHLNIGGAKKMAEYIYANIPIF